MTGRTHLTVGLALGVIVGHFARVPRVEVVALALVAGVAGLAPDVDHPWSILGRRVPLGRARYRDWPKRGRYPWRTPEWPNTGAQVGRKCCGATLWHRGPTHSLGALAVSSWLVYVLALWLAHGGRMAALPWVLAWGIGYGSHLLLDGMNKAGQMAFWPLSRGYFWAQWLPHFYQASTAGKVAEWVASGVAVGLAFVVTGGL